MNLLVEACSKPMDYRHSSKVSHSKFLVECILEPHIRVLCKQATELNKIVG